MSDHEVLRRRLEALKDGKATKVAELRSYQEQLKNLKETVATEYNVELNDLPAYADAQEKQYQEDMTQFMVDLENAEGILKEIESKYNAEV